MSIQINNPAFQFYAAKGLLWFRVFGVGLHFRTRNAFLLYSELINAVRVYRIGPLYVKVLKRSLTHTNVQDRNVLLRSAE